MKEKKNTQKKNKTICHIIKRHRVKILVSVATFLVVLSACAVGVLGSLHASCAIDWVFTSQCNDIKDAIVKQIITMKGPSGCAGGGEKCLYTLTSNTTSQVTATHETPVKHYVDDLTFSFMQSGSTCKVHGFSTSETWYAVLDYGTNYCNLENLITGAKLDKSTGYVETTSDSKCTQYSSHNCDKY